MRKIRAFAKNSNRFEDFSLTEFDQTEISLSTSDAGNHFGQFQRKAFVFTVKKMIFDRFSRSTTRKNSSEIDSVRREEISLCFSVQREIFQN